LFSGKSRSLPSARVAAQTRLRAAFHKLEIRAMIRGTPKLSLSHDLGQNQLPYLRRRGRQEINIANGLSNSDDDHGDDPASGTIGARSEFPGAPATGGRAAGWELPPEAAAESFSPHD
jgi:hypothetical protein